MAYVDPDQLTQRLARKHPADFLQNDWRCLECGKLLGVRRGAKLHVRVQGHDYTVSLPAEAICRGCGTHNRT
ncbi:hypothetical protein [Cypionkella psychrotolerans]|uniref:hypothetical protein n=1 Tax=Cypionkella psychrotolerans TaxID=1678131 RepID=UPI0006B4A51F|nr:hypothetical protein [Cypionkella psychrotolerans]